MSRFVTSVSIEQRVEFGESEVISASEPTFYIRAGQAATGALAETPLMTVTEDLKGSGRSKRGGRTFGRRSRRPAQPCGNPQPHTLTHALDAPATVEVLLREPA